MGGSDAGGEGRQMRSRGLHREHDAVEPHRRDRLAEICDQYLGKGQLVSLEGRLQTRRWEDDHKIKHYRTEIVASSVEMLSGRRKKDYAAETAAQALETQAEMMGLEPVDADDFDSLDEEVVEETAENATPALAPAGDATTVSGSARGLAAKTPM